MPLCAGRERKQIERGEQTIHVGALAQKTDESSLWMRACQGFQRAPFRSIADNEELPGWAEVGYRCSQQKTNILALDQPTNSPDCQRVCRQSKLGPHSGAHVRPGLILAKIDAVLDDHQLRFGCHTAGAGALGNLRRHGDKTVY